MAGNSPADDTPNGTPADSTGGSALDGPIVPSLVALVILGVGLWFVRPWIHWIVYGLYTTPAILVPLSLAAVAGWIVRGYEATSEGTDEYGPSGNNPIEEVTPLRGAAIVFVLAWMLVGPINGMVVGESLSDRTLAETEVSETLDDVDPDRPRIVTRAVADRFASNTLNRPQYRAGDTDISVVDGKPHWAAPLAPDGLFNFLTLKQGGTILVDMTTQQSNVRTVDGNVADGIGTIFFRNHRWHTLKQGEYLVNYGDPKMIVHEGEQYVLVPYTKPTFHLTPFPHSTPEWGGVALLDASGELEMLSPDEAAAHPALEAQALYPERLARQKVAATKYRNGIINTFTSHRGEIEVAPVPGENNDQPFFILTENGPQYVVAVEPYGEAQGLREVWSIDVQTGHFEVFRTPANESLFGPQKAAQLVKQSRSEIDWRQFSPAEPILTVIDDEPYWQVRVVPEDNSAIAYVAFVNARTSDVREFDRTAAVREFLAGNATTDRTPAGGQDGPPTGREPRVIVQRVGSDGSVLETIRVYENETVRIRPGTNGNVTAQASG